jgi:hypothetical protein
MAFDTDKMASWQVKGKTADKRLSFKIAETIFKIINKGER